MTLAGAGLAGADSVPDAKGTASAALKAYAAMDYTQAGKLARTIPHTPEGRLVSGLCDVYDRTRQDIRRGQLTLAELFYNDKTPLPYRLEAGVALGRTTQLMKERRDLYRDAADRYDHVKIFEAVRKLAPGSSAERYSGRASRPRGAAGSGAAFSHLRAGCTCRCSGGPTARRKRP